MIMSKWKTSIECVVRNQKGTGNGRSKGKKGSHGSKRQASRSSHIEGNIPGKMLLVQ